MKIGSLLKTNIGILCCLHFQVASALASNWQAIRLVSFNSTNGSNPVGGLIEGTDGNLYGTTSSGGDYSKGTVFKMTLDGSLSTLLSFDLTNGASPQAKLFQADNRNFYGTTEGFGTNHLGTVFMMTPPGVLTTIASFNGTNGINPVAPMVQGSDGYLYGTTRLGGPGCGCGSVFKAPVQAGPITTVVAFTITNGSDPVAGLIRGSDDYLYGIVEQGGPTYGAVFKISPAGQYSILASFTGPNGGYPQGGLVDGGDGYFYGSTYAMGPANAGTIFKITPTGAMTTLTSFGGGTLAKGRDGNLYGATYTTVFSMTPSGNVTTLASIESSVSGPLIQVSDGCFYGTTSSGGETGNGSIFKLIPSMALGTPIKISTTAFQITCTNVVGRTAVLESSTDLQNWFPIYTNSTDFEFLDNSAAPSPWKFYRARSAQ